MSNGIWIWIKIIKRPIGHRNTSRCGTWISVAARIRSRILASLSSSSRWRLMSATRVRAAWRLQNIWMTVALRFCLRTSSGPGGDKR